MENTPHTPDASGQPGLTVADRRDLIARHMAALEDLIDPDGRSDGWTPAARKGFLRLVAEHGRVSDACLCVGLSRQSAYSLRARDPLFALGWDAACQMARMPLADRLYEQAVDGITDTITRDDGSIVTRHRLDSRLSIAVLGRLDRRCDKAVEAGSRHLGAIAHWDEFIAAIGDDDPAAALAIIDTHHATLEQARAKTVQHRQPCQLRPDDEQPEEEQDLPDPRIWWDTAHKAYRTNFPPPEGADVFEQERFGHRDYQRDLTEEEAALLAARDNAAAAKRRAADEAERAAFFASMGEDLVTPCSSPLGEVARSDGGVGATSTPPSAKADTSPKGEGQGSEADGGGLSPSRSALDEKKRKKPPPDVKSSPDA